MKIVPNLAGADQSSVRDKQELRYTDYVSIEKKVSKAEKPYYIWRLEL